MNYPHMIKLGRELGFWTALFIGFNSAFAWAEPLSEPSPLPVHDKRDAYKPAAAWLIDNYLVIWQSGRIGPGDLRDGFNYIGDIVGCVVDAEGHAVSKDPFVVCQATDLQEAPSIATGKGAALVVWQDIRNGKDWDVFAARVTAQGAVLDPNGFLVSGGPHNQARPSVAWDGRHWVVVWQDFRRDNRYDVYAARINSDGDVIDEHGIQLSTNEVHCIDPTVASSGDGRSFVYWSQGRLLGREVAQSAGLFLVSGKPAPLLPDDHLTRDHDKQPGWGNTPPVAAAGKDLFLLAWRNEHPVGRGNGSPTVNAYMYDYQGKYRNSLTLAGVPHRIASADLAWDGAAFVASWTEYRTTDRRKYPAHEQVFAARIGPTGKHAYTAELVAGASDAPAANPAIASDGRGASLIAYEQHPVTSDVPITLHVRLRGRP